MTSADLERARGSFDIDDRRASRCQSAFRDHEVVTLEIRGGSFTGLTANRKVSLATDLSHAHHDVTIALRN
jgi:hypothetical protein